MKTVTVALMTNSKVLLLQRNPNAYPHYVDPFPYSWELIGGHVEDGEEPLVAAIREVWEETGIQVKSVDLLACGMTFFHEGRDSNSLYLAQLAEELPVTLASLDESRGYQAEHLSYAWTPITQASSMALAFKHTELLHVVCEQTSFV